MKKKGVLIAAVLAVMALSFSSGYLLAQHKHRKNEALRAAVNASGIVAALLDLEHGKVNYARGVLMVTLDDDVLRMKANDDVALSAGDEQFKLEKLRWIAKLRKEYPPAITPETAEMQAGIDAYLAEKTK